MIIASGTVITTLISTLAQAIIAVFAYLLAVHNTKNDKSSQKKSKIDAAKAKIDEVCDKGNLSDLLDATKQLGDAKKNG